MNRWLPPHIHMDGAGRRAPVLFAVDFRGLERGACLSGKKALPLRVVLRIMGGFFCQTGKRPVPAPWIRPKTKQVPAARAIHMDAGRQPPVYFIKLDVMFDQRR